MLRKNIIFLFVLLLVWNGISVARAAYLPKSVDGRQGYVYRFWSDVFRGHFFTVDYSEASRVKDLDNNWSYEQVAFNAFYNQELDSLPLYRFWSDKFKGHFYTDDENEMRRVRDSDSNWSYEKIAFYVYPLSYTGHSKIVYRFWSPIFRHHFYTADENEMARVRDNDTNWMYEGAVFRTPILQNDWGDLYQVIKVVDGDTIKVLVDGKLETIRLIGMDTPEIVDPRKPVQCFGREASDKAKEILNGVQVYLESDSSQGERDKYDRLLRYVILADGTNYNKLMIEQGYAHEYTYNLPYKYQMEFKQAEEQARIDQVGLWAPNTCGGDTDQPALQSLDVEIFWGKLWDFITV